jgi:acyl dehydratase
MGWDREPPRVGDRAERSRRVTEDDITRFVELSGDRNPIHLDPEVAAATGFGEVVVQGGVTTAILNAVCAQDLPGPGSVFMELNLRFLAPVRPGDEITGRCTVTDVRRDKPITWVDLEVERDDGVVAVRGTGVCWTMALPG